MRNFNIICFSATELHNYGAESNETFYDEGIYIKVVYLGIGFLVRTQLRAYDLKCRCIDWDGGGLVF